MSVEQQSAKDYVQIMRLETCEIRLARREGETYKKQLEDLGREHET